MLFGVRRFEEIQKDLGIARNVLQTRLERLVAEGVLERRPYQERPLRHEYFLTEKGLDLWPALVALMQWGDKYATPPDEPATVIEHRDCGGTIDEHRICVDCGARVSVRDARALPGPGASATHPLLRRASHTQTITG